MLKPFYNKKIRMNKKNVLSLMKRAASIPEISVDDVGKMLIVQDDGTFALVDFPEVKGSIDVMNITVENGFITQVEDSTGKEYTVSEFLDSGMNILTFEIYGLLEVPITGRNVSFTTILNGSAIVECYLGDSNCFVYYLSIDRYTAAISVFKAVKFTGSDVT